VLFCVCIYIINIKIVIPTSILLHLIRRLLVLEL